MPPSPNNHLEPQPAKDIPIKSILTVGTLIVFLAWLVSLPYWIQKPFTPLERVDMRQVNGIDAILKPVTQLYRQSGQPVVISLFQPGCFCNLVSRRHEQQIEAFAKQKGVAFHRVDASNLNLPSTPALLILNDKSELLYFGAYGFGAFCSQSVTFYAQKQLALHLNGYSTQPMYNLQGNGCYCRPKSYL